MCKGCVQNAYDDFEICEIKRFLKRTVKIEGVEL